MLETRFRGDNGVELAQTILQALRKHCIPPTPRNYELWTAYQLGVLPDLTRELGGHIVGGEPITEQITAALYDRHIGSTRLSTEVLEATDTMARELAETLANLRSASKGAGDYNSELRTVTSEIEAGLDPGSVKRVISKLTAATKKMLMHNVVLEQRMEESAVQISALQETLQTVRLEALTDSLTGLANRKHFEEAFQRHCLDAHRSGRPLSLILCDIDHFKRINDSYGHPVGDCVLRFVAAVLKRAAAGGILAARYGGEEFAIILPDTTAAAAVEWAERVRGAIRAQRPMRKSTGESLGVITLSFGVAQLGADEPTASLIQKADDLLYRAKHAGRDCVVSQLVPVAA